MAAGRIMQPGVSRVGDACHTPSLTQIVQEVWKVEVEIYLCVRKVRRLLREFPRIWCFVDNFCKEFLHRTPWESDERCSCDITTEKDRQTEGHNIHISLKLITSYRTSGMMGEYLEVFYGHTYPKLYMHSPFERIFRFGWFYSVSGDKKYP
jgi:hypothetical protein